MSRRWLFAIGLLVLAGCATNPPAPVTDDATRWRTIEIGLCEDYPEESRSLAAARRDLAAAREAGATVLRIAFGWDAMEPERGRFDWSFWDDFVREATDVHGIRLIPYVCYTPRWAAVDQGPDFWRSPPRDPADFGRFVEAIVIRYRDRIHSWELWNEPDNQAYWLGTTAQFGALIRAGADAVRRAHPQATIVLGGIAAELDFLATVLGEERLGEVVDVVNVHSYYETWHPSPIEHLPVYLDSAAGLIRETGAPKPLWMAEVGYSSVGGRAAVSSVYRAHFVGEHTDFAQAAALARTFFATIATDKVSLFAWYRINDLVPAQDVIGDDNNRHLGVLTVDGAKKPAYATFRYLAELFRQPFQPLAVRAEISPAAAQTRVHAFRLRDRRVVLAAWLPMPEGPAGPSPIPDPRIADLRVTLPDVDARRVMARNGQAQPVTEPRLVRRGANVEITFRLRGADVLMIELRP